MNYYGKPLMPVLELLKKLIACPSITPDDAGCQEIIAAKLSELGFKLEWMPFGEVKNLWARIGNTEPLVAFAGHTDVVPTGPLSTWQSDPFTPTIRADKLYGRGATDMKSGLAAMIIAAANFLQNHADFTGSIAFLITSDEEGASINGTQKVINKLTARHEKITYCIIGEASSEKLLGDQIRVGRRGSLHGDLTIYGKQGHIAYPHLTRNPIHLSLPALSELAATAWDEGNEFFPPTSWQISNIHAGTGATNVVPGELAIKFNFRFSTAVTVEQLQHRVKAILDHHNLNYDLAWDYSGVPFLTKQGKLVAATQQAIATVTGLTAQLSTAGGTSDGRFIAPTGAEVIELGPCNASAHQVDEHIALKELQPLCQIYTEILKNIFF
jgi:succinyl-diaminopimelate desuccinylase